MSPDDIAREFALGIAWTPVVDTDVTRILAASTTPALDAAAADAYSLAAHRSAEFGSDLRAHLFRIRTATAAQRLELRDLADARAAAWADRPGPYAVAISLGAAADPWEMTR